MVLSVANGAPTTGRFEAFWGVAFGQQPVQSLRRREALCAVTPPERLTLVAARTARAVVPGEIHEALAVLAGGLQGKTLLAQALQQ